MRYLKSYESLRTGTEIIDIKQAQDIIDGLDYFNSNDLKIFRSTKITANEKNIFIIDPKEYERKSANTDNYYTYLIDNSKEWKYYPKRSKSLICSTVDSKFYGYEYIVIPLEPNSNWGVCESEDFWGGFSKSNIFSIRYLNQFLDLLKFDLLKDYDNRQDNKENFFNFLEILEKKITPFDDNMIDRIKNLTLYKNDFTIFLLFFKQGFDKGQSLIEIFDNILEPQRNGFELYGYNDLVKEKILHIRKHEVWTDSKCLLLSTSSYEINNNKIKIK